MCFLLLHHRTRADAPLVLLANRDEAFDRPFDPPTWRGPQGGVLAPRDRRAGGTWLGLTRAGLVVALTNRREEVAVVGTRSRGLLVEAALAHGDARSACAWAVEHLAGEAYAGFNLLVADARAAYVLRHPGAAVPRRPERSDVRSLPPGAHVLTNLHDLDEVTVPPSGRPEPEEPLARSLERLERLAADATTVLPGDHRILKRGPERGTVCSAVVALAATGDWAVRFADGPPDRTSFRAILTEVVR